MITAGVHPRIHFTPATLATYQARAAGSHAGLWSQLRQACDARLTWAVTDFADEWGEELGALGLAWMIDGPSSQTNSYGNHAVLIATQLGGLPPDPSRTGLRRLLGLAYVYDYLHGFMAASTRTAILGAIEAQLDFHVPRLIPQERFGWGESTAIACACACALHAVSLDGNGTQNTKFADQLGTVSDWLDNGATDCLFATFRHFDPTGDGGCPFGSGGQDTKALEWVLRYCSSADSAEGSAYLAEPWFLGHIQWLLWHWSGFRGFHQENERAREGVYDVAEQIYAAMISGLDQSITGRHALWLAQEIGAHGVHSIDGGQHVWNLRFLDTARTPRRPEPGEMGGKVKVFPNVAKIVARESWLSNGISVAVSAPRYHLGGAQHRSAGDHSLHGFQRALVRRGAWDAKQRSVTYRRAETELDSGARYSYGHRNIAGSMISLHDDEAHTANAEQVVHVRPQVSSGLGIKEEGLTDEHFAGAGGDTYRYINTGDQLLPKPGDYLSRIPPTGWTPEHILDLLSQPVWDGGSPFVSGPTIGQNYAHACIDLTEKYPLKLNSGFVPGTHFVRRHFYFMLPGAVPGWDRLAYFTVDEVSAPTSSIGKLTKRTFIQTATIPAVEGVGGGPLPRLAAYDSETDPVAKVFLDVLLPVGAERVDRQGAVDLEGNEYPQEIPPTTEPWKVAPINRLEINPPDEAELVRFLTVYWPAPAGAADAPPTVAVDDATHVGITAGYPTTQKSFLIPKDLSAAPAPSGPIDSTAPATPSGFMIEEVPGGVRSSWSQNTETDVQKYVVERRSRVPQAPPAPSGSLEDPVVPFAAAFPAYDAPLIEGTDPAWSEWPRLYISAAEIPALQAAAQSGHVRDVAVAFQQEMDDYEAGTGNYNGDGPAPTHSGVPKLTRQGVWPWIFHYQIETDTARKALLAETLYGYLHEYRTKNWGPDTDANPVDSENGRTGVCYCAVYDALHDWLAANTGMNGWSSITQIRNRIAEELARYYDSIANENCWHNGANRSTRYFRQYLQNHCSGTMMAIPQMAAVLKGEGHLLTTSYSSSTWNPGSLNEADITTILEQGKDDIRRRFYLSQNGSGWNAEGTFYGDSGVLGDEAACQSFARHFLNWDCLSTAQRYVGQVLRMVYNGRPSKTFVDEMLHCGDIATSNTTDAGRNKGIGFFRLMARHLGNLAGGTQEEQDARLALAQAAQWVADMIISGNLSATVVSQQATNGFGLLLDNHTGVRTSGSVYFSAIHYDPSIASVGPQAQGWPLCYFDPDRRIGILKSSWVRDSVSDHYAIIGGPPCGREYHKKLMNTHDWDAGDSQYTNHNHKTGANPVPVQAADEPQDFNATPGHAHPDCGRTQVFLGELNRWSDFLIAGKQPGRGHGDYGRSLRTAGQVGCYGTHIAAARRTGELGLNSSREAVWNTDNNGNDRNDYNEVSQVRDREDLEYNGTADLEVWAATKRIAFAKANVTDMWTTGSRGIEAIDHAVTEHYKHVFFVPGSRGILYHETLEASALRTFTWPKSVYDDAVTQVHNGTTWVRCTVDSGEFYGFAILNPAGAPGFSVVDWLSPDGIGTKQGQYDAANRIMLRSVPGSVNVGLKHFQVEHQDIAAGTQCRFVIFGFRPTSWPSDLPTLTLEHDDEYKTFVRAVYPDGVEEIYLLGHHGEDEPGYSGETTFSGGGDTFGIKGDFPATSWDSVFRVYNGSGKGSGAAYIRKSAGGVITDVFGIHASEVSEGATKLLETDPVGTDIEAVHALISGGTVEVASGKKEASSTGISDLDGLTIDVDSASISSVLVNDVAVPHTPSGSAIVL